MKMNERIRELFDRAEHQALKHLGSDLEVYVEPSREQIFEKFAELIVRECANIANAGIDPAESHLIGDDIKEHFGVDTKINTNKKIEESLHKADKDIQEGLRKQYLEQLTRLNGDLS